MSRSSSVSPPRSPSGDGCVPQFSEDDAVRLALEHHGLRVRARRLASYLDQNFRLEGATGRELVLKISNSEERFEDLDLQHRMMEVLARSFGADAIPRVVPTTTGKEVVTASASGQDHLIRVVTFLPGIFMSDVTPHTPELLTSLGTFLGNVNRALEGFSHPAMHRDFRWNLTLAGRTIGTYAPQIASGEDRGLVEHFRTQLETHLPQVEPQLRRSVIHSDANDNNVLVGHTRSGSQRVTGLIDFGDAVHSYTVGEVAIAAAYAMLGKAEPLEAAAHVAGGYHAAYPLTDPELVVLFDLICARLAVSVSISAHGKKSDPGNAYVAVSESGAWDLLRKLVWVSRGQAYDMFRKACRMGPPTPSADTIDLSSYKFDGPGGVGAPKWVHKVAMPDVYRGPYKASDPEAGRRYAGHVAEAVRAIRKKRRRLAAFFCESMLGCGGQIVLPEGYLGEAARHVRQAGGVVVADEVQVGFGRAGSHFWSFEMQDVVPDIVTLGKPIGNGHPLAAVVTTPEIAASFDNGMEYFNTFGGNPVSCAVGLAVLDAIEDDGLQENARAVGAHLLDRLSELMQTHPLIGDVRGRGLFLGVELVRDRRTLKPAAEEAAAIVEAMKERGILLSTDGPLHNVIKIKPPIVFSMADADRVADTLDAVLATP